jgi:hypothetical protein
VIQLTFQLCPLHGQALGVEPAIGQQFTLFEKLRLDAPLAVVTQLTPKVCMVRRARELDEQLPGRGVVLRRRKAAIWRAERLVDHSTTFRLYRSTEIVAVSLSLAENALFEMPARP